MEVLLHTDVLVNSKHTKTELTISTTLDIRSLNLLFNRDVIIRELWMCLDYLLFLISEHCYKTRSNVYCFMDLHN